MRAKPFFVFQFEKPDPPKPDRKDGRNDARTELRNSFNNGLVRVTGRDEARIWYAIWRYALWVVDRYGFKFNDGGWPSDIPFRDLNRIPGGTHVFRRLQSRWDSGLLWLVRASEEDKRNARRDPRLLIPNTSQRAAALGTAIPRAPSRKLVHCITDLASRFQLDTPDSSATTGVVLHPATMRPHFTFSVLPGGAPAPNASGARPLERAQRSDINKSRKRPITNPEGRELRHPKRGPMTTKFVVEAEGIAGDEVGEAIESGRIVLTDEILTDCVDVPREAGGSRSRRLGVEEWFSSSDIEPEDDIEMADEWDAELRAERLRY
ncbi:hypothetical protein GSI_05662 [Ganoderma sinense ZZ0214-1]|uniref:Uncharacterized protein n=1 Tax=Ganoderma sinense ZZ0214-1 TaxID=1077348 RepID=A0A2G8S2Z7_9APHY|nr:hypothetical protein GSI_09796 [Ganoderma sinense ZZ0214-1]PIL32416.1 hypothetical protein GSI_05662 [Ganoderma sinense ZZ0214-1]